MGNPILEEDMPIERQDLSEETQIVFGIYDFLPSRWEGMSGTYMGKDLTLLPTLLEGWDSSIQQYAWSIIQVIDYYVAEDISRKQKAASKSKKSGS